MKNIRNLAAFAVAVAGLAASSNAASINYGNFSIAGVIFGNVTESSGTDAVPLYGPPEAFVTGLDFDPIGFVAFSGSGGADLTDGQLNFTVASPLGIPSISLTESGDYTLAGIGTSATQALAGAIISVRVLEVNGVAVAPISIAPSNATVGFNLVANSGLVQPWSLGITSNIAGQLPVGSLATKIEVVIDNSLVAVSEASSVASISKKDFAINIPVPEPTSLAASLSFLGIAGRRRK